MFGLVVLPAFALPKMALPGIGTLLPPFPSDSILVVCWFAVLWLVLASVPFPVRLGVRKHQDVVAALPRAMPEAAIAGTTASALRDAGLRMEEQYLPENTKLAYEPKINEFKSFCRFAFGSHGAQDLYVITNEKVRYFMFYQCFRNKRQQGKTRSAAEEEDSRFDPADFTAVITKYGSISDRSNIPDPENPLGFDQVNTYKAALLKLFERQVSQNLHGNITWAHIWCRDCYSWMKLVKQRRARVKRNKFLEKADESFAPFAAVDEVNRIEEALWTRAEGTNLKVSFSWLRH